MGDEHNNSLIENNEDGRRHSRRRRSTQPQASAVGYGKTRCGVVNEHRTRRTSRPKGRMRTATTDTTTTTAVAAAGTAVAGSGGAGRQAATPTTGSSRPDADALAAAPSQRPDGASAQPAGERSFIVNPLTPRTIDGPPTPDPERPAALPKKRHQTGRSNPADRRHAVTCVPVRLRQQHPVNQHHQQPNATFPGPSRTQWHPLTRAGTQ